MDADPIAGPRPGPISGLHPGPISGLRPIEVFIALVGGGRGETGDERAANDDACEAVFLVDDGDLTHPTDADLHERWISGLLDDALTLGAHHARVGAGRSAPTPELIASSARRMSRLADDHPGVQVVVENWREMMPDADAVLALLADAGDIRVLIDLGNWTMPDKHEQLARIADGDNFAEGIDAFFDKRAPRFLQTGPRACRVEDGA